MANKILYKTVDLFGYETVNIVNKKRTSKKNLFTDYDNFVDKFEAKKTTDDCYTPKEVYKIIIDYVNEKCDLTNKKIIRPFYPGGDYESIDYDNNCVIIDNPPFSIISKICKYYIEKDIKFFLFCPHLTAFSSKNDATYIIANADVTYENGATIKTAFVSNMFGNAKIIADAELNKKFKELQGKNKANLPKYKYPENIITVSKIAYFVDKGVSLTFYKNEVEHCRQLDDQKKHGKTLFGSGFLASNKAAAAVAAAVGDKKDNVIVWKLSPRELEIIKKLDNY